MAQIQEMMGKGMFITQIVRDLADEWGCSESRVYQYVKVVKDVMKKQFEDSSGSVISQFMHLYKMALDKNDYRTANLIAGNLAKFTKVEKVSFNGEVSYNINFGGDGPDQED